MPPLKDFDETGKLVTVAKSPKGPSVLANPAALAPTGSPAGRLAAADGIRSCLTGFGVYGALIVLNQALDFFGANPQFLGPHGVEIAAFAVAVSHLIHAFMSDNTAAAK